MKTLIGVVLAALVTGVAALAWTFTAETLPVSEEFAIALPAANPPAEFSVSVLHTGRMFSKAAFAYRGGSFSEERVFGMSPVLLQHPQGALLVDAGFGRNVDAHFRTTPALMQALSKYEKGTPAADQFQAAGLDPTRLRGVMLTHAHWDHVSGLEDLRDVPVWLPQAELDFIRSDNPNTALARSFGDLAYKAYGFPDGPYLGFESSFDVFEDGSVVVVPAPGHTPGSVIVFATLASGRRYALIGDLAWQKEGVEIPAERPWLPRRLIGENDADTRRELARMHRLKAAVPDLIIVPAHDQRVLDTLPRFAAPAGNPQ
jgi:glyoxylase-like metal-dependent hydrolase (beta-lactamase superfamily II)